MNWNRYWEERSPKTRDQVIAEHGYTDLDLIGTGEMTSREGSKKTPVKKQYKAYNAKLIGEEVRILVVDKISGQDLLSQIFEVYTMVASEKEWMLLQRKNNH